MEQIQEQPVCRLLMRPVQLSKSPEKNIFASLRRSEPLPSIHKIRGKSYDLVGTKEQKQQWLQAVVPKRYENPEQEDFANTFNKMNTTINRQTIMSKLTREQTNLTTRQIRQISKHREYQRYWESESKKIHKRTQRKQKDKTLLEDNVKGLYAQENQSKEFLVKNYVNSYWEMSLRNNSKILKRQFLGNRYSDDQINELLQTDEGMKKIEASIPSLPIQRLKSVEKKGLVLSGRNRSLALSGDFTYRTSGSLPSIGSSVSGPDQEVFKISYDGNTKWMSMESFA